MAAHLMMTFDWTWRDLMATPVVIADRRLLVERVRRLVEYEASQRGRQ